MVRQAHHGGFPHLLNRYILYVASCDFEGVVCIDC
jgi:hypothetical protein